MSQSRLEFKVGFFVMLCLVLLAVLLLQFSKGASLFRPKYEIILESANVGGMRSEAPVLMSGVQIGSVSHIELAHEGTNVAIDLKIYNQYVVRDDALFKIEQSGFLGDQYVAIYPGTGLGTYYPEDITDVVGLVKRLQDKPDPISALLSDRLDDVARSYLAAWTPTDPDLTNMVTQLALNLNRLVLGPALYESNRFQNIQLRPITTEFLKRNPRGQDLALLNRMLLDDAFVGILSSMHEGLPFKDGATARAQEPFNLQEVARSAQGFIQRMDTTAKKLDDAISEVRRVVLNDKTLLDVDTTIVNLRNTTATALTTVSNINSLIVSNRGTATDAVSNLYTFTGKLNGIADRTDNILATNAPQFSATLSNLQASTATLSNLLAEINAGHGTVGRVLKDETMANNIEAVTHNLAVTTSNLNRLGFWHWLWYKPKPAATNANSEPVIDEHKR